MPKNRDDSGFWGKVFWFAGGISALISIYAFIFGVPDLQHLSNSLGFSHDKENVKRDYEKIEPIVNSPIDATVGDDNNIVIATLTNSDGIIDKYIYRSGIFANRQILKYSCTSNNICKKNLLFNLQWPMIEADTAFVDPDTGNLVVLDRYGHGFYFDPRGNFYKSFHFTVPCWNSVIYNGAGTSNGGVYAVRDGSLYGDTLTLKIDVLSCDGPGEIGSSTIEASAIKIPYGARGEIDVSMKFDIAGNLVSGDMKSARVSFTSDAPAWFSTESNRKSSTYLDKIHP